MSEPAEHKIIIKHDRYGHGERTFTMVYVAGCHCVNCGHDTVWMEEGSDDYYVGADYSCTSCQHTFTCQGPDIPSTAGDQEFMDLLVAEAVRNHG